MIKYVTGDLLSAHTQALVNTVNTVGVMGKGIALQFKEKYPNNFVKYALACKQKELVPGHLVISKEATIDTPEKIIINFPTKTEWYLKSKYEYIELGLKELVKTIVEYNIKSIAIPPLGCGNGGLQWTKIKEMMENYLSKFEDVNILIYEPSNTIKEVLKKQDYNSDIKLTNARALILYALFYYETAGEYSSLFVANKIAFFFKRLKEPSFAKLTFVQDYYGPYSVGVNHLIKSLDGKYLKGMRQMTAKPFEKLELNYEKKQEVSDYVRTKLKSEQIERLKKLIRLIDGFQSALSLEILASVDFIRSENMNISEEDAILLIKKWSDRKNRLCREKYISIAYRHLSKYANEFFL